tara:strand:+ start:763 stop:1155 length:393 start_codon:yes stop_codon:yes gene_type:complete
MQEVVCLALLTSANGTERTGATLSLANISAGGLTFKCESRITTASVLATYKVQVSDDAVTWYDVKLSNNASNVATAVGTGVEVITTLALVPANLAGWTFARCNVTLSGAATAAADKTKIDYKTQIFGYFR